MQRQQRFESQRAKMSVVRPFDKLPVLNSAAILLVGTDEDLQRQLAQTILKEKKDFKISIHLATSLPLPAERDHIRPRIDLIVFMINVQSKYGFKNIEASLAHVDANFFLGKVCFLVTGVGRDQNLHSSAAASDVADLCWPCTRGFCPVFQLLDEKLQ